MTAIPGTVPASGAAAATSRNRLGIVAFVMVILVLAAPIVMGIVTAIVGAVSGSTPGAGLSILGGFILAGITLALASPISVVAVVVAIVSLFRRRGRNGLGVWALVLGILPALIGPFLLPAALDTLF